MKSIIGVIQIFYIDSYGISWARNINCYSVQLVHSVVAFISIIVIFNFYIM